MLVPRMVSGNFQWPISSFYFFKYILKKIKTGDTYIHHVSSFNCWLVLFGDQLDQPMWGSRLSSQTVWQMPRRLLKTAVSQTVWVSWHSVINFRAFLPKRMLNFTHQKWIACVYFTKFWRIRFLYQVATNLMSRDNSLYQVV